MLVKLISAPASRAAVVGAAVLLVASPTFAAGKR